MTLDELTILRKYIFSKVEKNVQAKKVFLSFNYKKCKFNIKENFLIIKICVGILLCDKLIQMKSLQYKSINCCETFFSFTNFYFFNQSLTKLTGNNKETSSWSNWALSFNPYWSTSQGKNEAPELAPITQGLKSICFDFFSYQNILKFVCLHYCTTNSHHYRRLLI